MLKPPTGTPQHWIYMCAVVLSFASSLAYARNNGQALTPPMGWTSGAQFGCAINETIVKEMTDSMVNTGLRDAGYQYIVVDDCWAASRDANNTLTADPNFPSGLKALADYVHARGLKLGLSTSAGTATCTLRPGSGSFESQDANTFAAWGVDYVQANWCNGFGTAQGQFPVLGNALAATGKPIVYSIDNSGSEAAFSWGGHVSEQFRAYPAMADNYSDFLNRPITSVTWPYTPFSGPNSWLDLGNLQAGGSLTVQEYRTQFSLWAMHAAPLFLQTDLRAMSLDIATILTNKEIIAVDQDPYGRASSYTLVANGLSVWAKPLSSGGVAVATQNDTATAADITFTFASVGLQAGTPYPVRDLWQHAYLGFYSDQLTASAVAPHDVAVFVIGEPPPPVYVPPIIPVVSETNSGTTTAGTTNTGGTTTATTTGGTTTATTTGGTTTATTTGGTTTATTTGGMTTTTTTGGTTTGGTTATGTTTGGGATTGGGTTAGGSVTTTGGSTTEITKKNGCAQATPSLWGMVAAMGLCYMVRRRRFMASATMLSLVSVMGAGCGNDVAGGSATSLRNQQTSALSLPMPPGIYLQFVAEPTRVFDTNYGAVPIAIDAYSANGGVNQKWTFQNGQIVANGSNYCMDAVGGSIAGATALTAGGCDSSYATPTQLWTYQDGTLRFTGSTTCIALGSDNTVAAQSLVFTTCDSSDPLQQIYLSTTAFQITPLGSPLALTANARGAGPNSVTLANYVYSPGQYWTLEGSALKADGLCVDSTSPTAANGTPLQVAVCNGSPSQQWYYDLGALRQTNTSKCVYLDSGNTTVGTVAELSDCVSRGAGQQFVLSAL